MQSHKSSTQKSLELINEFSKSARYNINMQKSAAFVYANNEVSERQSKKKIHPIYMESRKMVLMNSSAGQQWRCKHGEETCGHSRGRSEWNEQRE